MEFTQRLSVVTFAAAALSFFGSLMVIGSYALARTKTKPKAAQLILNLAVNDLVWFLATIVEFSFLIAPDPGGVPDVVCLACSPLIIFTRMASLIWTCAISFDVYMSLNRRKWFLKDEENRWNAYRRTYILLVLIFGSPAAIVSMVRQNLNGQANLGCSPGYEKLGLWYEIFFAEILPIVGGFWFNFVMYILVRRQMQKRAFPQSVRKRRRRIQYYYMIACIVCWSPTIIYYTMQLLGVFGPLAKQFEIFSRCTLYLSGFANFLIFGTSDPHLRRAMLVCAYYFGLTRCFDSSTAVLPNTVGINGGNEKHFSASEILRQQSTEKVVMFSGQISNKADIAHSKRHVYTLLLSKEQKALLYNQRPDLDPQESLSRTSSSTPSSSVAISAPLNTFSNVGKPKSILKKRDTNQNNNSTVSTVEIIYDDISPSPQSQSQERPRSKPSVRVVRSYDSAQLAVFQNDGENAINCHFNPSPTISPNHDNNNSSSVHFNRRSSNPEINIESSSPSKNKTNETIGQTIKFLDDKEPFVQKEMLESVYVESNDDRNILIDSQESDLSLGSLAEPLLTVRDSFTLYDQSRHSRSTGSDNGVNDDDDSSSIDEADDEDEELLTSPFK